MLTLLRRRQPGAPLARVLFFELCRTASYLVLRGFFGLRASRADRVPVTGALLVAANHQSYLDPPAVGGPIWARHFTFIARAGLFKFKPFAWMIANLNSIPIREDQSDAAAIKEAIRRLEGGAVVLIFPEGSRSSDGRIRPFKRGVALLVKKARCPVLPAAIDGAFEAWPNSRKIPRPFGRPIHVKYGEPIPYDELMKDGAEAALERIEREVRALWNELRRERGLPGEAAPDATP
ncbi:1-acyl-sn-glycerol-3-phosphate acyltransferase [Phycisphaerales bacterium]|nr:1-acyl-sn-glycerol-3-phosphate acyltransferase [Phycisphaerales bacterium]